MTKIKLFLALKILININWINLNIIKWIKQAK